MARKAATITPVPASDCADNPALLTSDAAAYVGLHEKTLLKLARKRQLEFIQFAPGGPVRFRRSALNAYLEAHARPARAAEA